MPFAVPKFFHIDLHSIQKRKPQVADGGFLGVGYMPTCLEGSTSSTGKEHREVFVVVGIAIMNATSIRNHGVIQQTSFAFLDRFEFL